MKQFNWQYASLNAVSDWIQAGKTTRYSPYGFELESQDALGVSSGAIYDYFGRLPTANGVNMRQDEMAFTSFEQKDDVVLPDNPQTPDYGVESGNWILKGGTIPDYTYYTIRAGNGNLALVEATVAQLGSTVSVDVAATLPFNYLAASPTRTYLENEIICVSAYTTNPAWSIVLLKTAPNESIWVGTMRIKNTVTPTAAPVFDNTKFHSGTQSLKITTDLTIKQDLLNLDVGKSYVLNAWVQPNNINVQSPQALSGLGISITARQQNGTLITTFPLFAPSGPVIESWQQVRGTFTIPANTAYIKITFKAGAAAGTAWYDDLRLHPEGGNMKSYVYTSDFRLRAILDEENFASFFYYDVEGNLYLTKKETKDGIKTLTENISYLKER